MKLLNLTKGKQAKVDDEDFEMLSEIRWRASNHGHTDRCDKFYARNDGVGYMHRYLMACPKDMVVDHVNGDGLDNQKSNLRLLTRGENAAAANWWRGNGRRQMDEMNEYYENKDDNKTECTGEVPF